MNTFIRFAGYADSPTLQQVEKYPAWVAISNTEEYIQKAIANGYTAISTTAFSHEPHSSKPEPIRKGSLFLDIDCKHDQIKGIWAAQKFVEIFCRQFAVHADSLHYWISGGKGCHIEIPAEIIGAQEGDTNLPQIYKFMIAVIMCRYKIRNLDNYLDMSMYCMGKGKLLRHENIKRKNGCYKVPVTAEEFCKMTANDLAALTHSSRKILSNTQNHELKISEDLVELYETVKEMYSLGQQQKHPITSIEAIMDCEFIKHCNENAQTLSEPEWFTMVSLLSPLRNIGKYLIHQLSSPYPDYSYDKTELKRKNAISNGDKARITCNHIKTMFKCTKQCSVSSPCDLWKVQKIQENTVASCYESNDDGLFLILDSGQLEKLSSPLKVICKMCSPDKLGWARLVHIKNNLVMKELEIPMRDVAKADLILSTLLDAGLEVCNYQLAKKHIPLYILNSAKDEGVRIMTNQLGWFENSYVLPDVTFGNEIAPLLRSNGLENIHQCTYELKDWQEQIGNLCKGNPLLVLSTALALTGPMLRLCGVEGIGINIFGPSSSGKTTCALIAGSVCGGGSRNGYVRSWRSTDNALEATAAMHNDGLLILDEIGQAMGDTIGRIVYMLSNGESKARMRADATLRKTSQWMLSILSTGELSIPDKIKESGRFQAMAGQEVRIIDLPIDADCDKSIYEDMHGFKDGAQLSDTLTERAKLYYGTPLRSFLECLCKDKDAYVNRIMHELDIFVATNCPKDASGQVQRVCRKFALMASVGELAYEFGIFPYEKGECHKAAISWFNVWLVRRKGIGNLEVENAIKTIEDAITMQGETHFIDMSRSVELGYARSGYLGYRWTESKIYIFFILAPHFSKLCGNANKAAVEKELKKRKMVKLNCSGNIMNTKSVNGENHRGIGIVINSRQKNKLVEICDGSIF